MKPCADLLAALTAIRVVAKVEPAVNMTLITIQREAHRALAAHKDCSCISQDEARDLAQEFRR